MEAVEDAIEHLSQMQTILERESEEVN